MRVAIRGFIKQLAKWRKRFTHKELSVANYQKSSLNGGTMRGLIIAAMLLSGCGGPSLSDNQRKEVQNIAEDFADATSFDAAENVNMSEIESRLDDLEDGNRRAIEADKVELDSLQRQGNDIKDLRTELEGLIKHYNTHLIESHGAK